MSYNLFNINLQLAKDAPYYCALLDQAYRDQLQKIADDILENRHERPVVLLAGPSGSGKTTTALILEKILDNRDCETHTLSLDNYFKPLTAEERELSAQGKMDLESPNRVDIPLLNEQLSMIIDCMDVAIPKYDFAKSCRVPSVHGFCRRPGEVVILEGIHALNPEVITVPDHQTAKVYASVKSSVTAGNLTLEPKRIRLLRRMIRDQLFRNRTYAETLSMFPFVDAGEQKYIAPFMHQADYEIDTFIPYELGVYKTIIGDDSFHIKNHGELRDLEEILEQVEPVEIELVKETSLIREFIGNGEFSY